LGDFEKHRKTIEEDHVYQTAVLLESPEQLASLDGVILSGVDPIAMLASLDASGLFEPLREFARERPVFGTGGGAVLVAHEAVRLQIRTLDLVDVTMECETDAAQSEPDFVHVNHTLYQDTDDAGGIHAAFLRSPRIVRAGSGTETLAMFFRGDAEFRKRTDPLMVAQGMHMAATFHPQLGGDWRCFYRFSEKVRDNYWRLRMASQRSPGV
jgi:5'-phosphate synthase pdxT subunit